MNKKLIIFLTTVLLAAVTSLTVFAAGNAISEYWYKEGKNWKILDGSGNTIRDSWVCDDKNNQNRDSNWYLMDSNGVMYEGVINDNGHYYLLNPNHDGNYGMMVSGPATYTYNNVTLQLETVHNGYFGEIKNPDAVLSLGLSVADVNTSGKPLLYTSEFGGSQAVPVQTDRIAKVQGVWTVVSNTWKGVNITISGVNVSNNRGSKEFSMVDITESFNSENATNYNAVFELQNPYKEKMIYTVIDGREIIYIPASDDLMKEFARLTASNVIGFEKFSSLDYYVRGN